MKKGKVGFFDSGYGGLSILKNVIKDLPEYDYIYLGDTARNPYGTRTQETIYEYTKQGMEFLIKQGCELIVIACNSASSEALPRIQEELINNNHTDKRILGVIIPASEEAVEKTKNGEVGVIATSSTVSSMAFVKEVKKLNKNVNVHQVACPLLVSLVESAESDDEIIKPIIEKYLKNTELEKVDTLILGCTHYGLIKDKILEVLKVLGKDIKIIDEGEVVSKKLIKYLENHPEINQKLSKENERHFYTTDLTDGFKKNGSVFLEQEIEVEKIDLN